MSKSGIDNLALLYSDKAALGWLELEKIVQAVALYSDEVFLHRNCFVSPDLDHEDRGEIAKKVRSFVDAGLVRIWEFESSRQPADPLDYVGHGLARSDVQVLSDEDYGAIESRINRKVQQYDLKIAGLMQQPLRGSPRPSGPSVEGFAELVHLRNNLWQALISDQLHATGLLTDARRATSLEREFDQYYASRDRETDAVQYFEEFARWHPLTGFSALNADDILAIRSHFKQFRQFVVGRIDSAALKLGDQVAVEESFERMKDAFMVDLEDEVRRRIPSKAEAISGSLRSIALTGAAFILAPLAVVSQVDQLIETVRRSRSPSGHVVYVLDLADRLKARRQGEVRQLELDPDVLAWSSRMF